MIRAAPWRLGRAYNRSRIRRIASSCRRSPANSRSAPAPAARSCIPCRPPSAHCRGCGCPAPGSPARHRGSAARKCLSRAPAHCRPGCSCHNSRSGDDSIFRCRPCGYPVPASRISRHPPCAPSSRPPCGSSRRPYNRSVSPFRPGR